jgi:L-glyceraldehyde 3-phosphate reductase
MLNRWVEHGLLDVLSEVGAGCIAFTALAQGMLTDKYLDGVPDGSRAAGQGATLSPDLLTGQRIDALRALDRVAGKRGQSLAQMALSWVLRDPRVTSVVVGASSVRQLEDNVAAINHTEFGSDELATIDAVATDDPDVDLWRAQSMIGPDTSAPHAAG